MSLSMFTEHPASVGETYLQHLWRATCFGARMVLCGLACLVHGLLPFLCVRTGSRAIATLHEQIVTHRDRRAVTVSGAELAPAIVERDVGLLS